MTTPFVHNFKSLLNELFPLPSKQPLFIAIDGRPCSGKTTLTMQLEQALNAQSIYLDEFFIPRKQWPKDQMPQFPFFYFRYQEFVNGIKTLAKGEPFIYHSYDWQTDAPSTTPTKITPLGIILVEGVSTLNIELVNVYYKKVWVDSDQATEIAAIEAREKGTHLNLWKNVYLPSVDIYCEQKPWERADIIYKGRGLI